MCMTLISISKVLEVMREWMDPFISIWTDDGDHWTFNYDNGEFYWVWASNSTNVVVYIGAKLCHQGKCIKIWSEHDDNTNIMITENSITFIQDSKFEHFFRESIYDLFTRLENSNDEAEEVMNKHLENESKCTEVNINQLPGIIVKQKFDLKYFELYKAYAIYDQADVCIHGILISASEDVLAFCTYGMIGSDRTELMIDIHQYIKGKFKIKPLIVSEQ